ncbi:DNA-binding SARP family transcriptional activator [Pseudonocardia eucalypti]|uniref:BTAD domain-containing putative transcriptional regulator n=1 Tax=Pseudonocardia eucalypti TaxID=648755 RepID=UPI0016186B35|nr:DNA-binding SARP family transcriptional activator [Pseudonocardia eucalypti]
MKATPAVLLGIGGGLVAAKVAHNRKKAANEPFQLDAFEHRIQQATGEARDQGEDLSSYGNPSTHGGWASLLPDVGPRALQIGGSGSEPAWLDLTATPGCGFRGPGAHHALCSTFLSILLRAGQRPPGRVIIPEPDAVRLLGTTRPDPSPENLYVLADLEHALAALDTEIAQRLANRAATATLPLVVLMLADPPADPTKAAELAALLRTGHRLGVTALMGGDWPVGSSIDIDAQFRVTATRGNAVGHLTGAGLAHWPPARVLDVCRRIDDGNRVASHRASRAANETTTTTADPAHAQTETHATETDATSATRTQPPDTGPTRPAAGTFDHQSNTAPDTGHNGADGDSLDGADVTHATGAAAVAPSSPAEPVTSPVPVSPLPGAGDPAAASIPGELDPGSPTAADRAEAAEPATTAPAGPATVPDNSAAPPSPDTNSGLVCRLDLMDTPRLTLISPDAGTPPVNITPSGRALVRMLVKLGLVRGPQRRTAVAAALWPETNIDRPTNTFNSYRTRLRQFIQKETNGAITDLIQDHEDGTCELRPDLFQVDYWEFQDATDPRSTADAPDRARAYQNALASYKGDLAGNIHDEWITEHRANTQQEALKAAINLAYELTNNHDEPETALAVLDQAVAFDPVHEPIYQHLIRLLLKLGRRDAAIQRYKTLERELDRELGIEPLPETTRLLWQ